MVPIIRKGREPAICWLGFCLSLRERAADEVVLAAVVAGLVEKIFLKNRIQMLQ